jgi:hypothetical protein
MLARILKENIQYYSGFSRVKAFERTLKKYAEINPIFLWRRNIKELSHSCFDIERISLS